MAETQYEKKEKVLRLDNALEFQDKQCKPFLKKKIRHHSLDFVCRKTSSEWKGGEEA